MDLLFSIILGQQNPYQKNYYDLEITIDDDKDETNQLALQLENDIIPEQNQQYNCYYCEKISNLQELRKHHRENHYEKKLKFKCQKCDLWFEYLKHLIVHQKIVNHEQLKDKIIFDQINHIGDRNCQENMNNSQEKQINDLIQINEDQQEQTGFQKDLMFKNQSNEITYRRSARTANKIRKSYNTELTISSKSSPISYQKTPIVQFEIFYGKPKAQRKPLMQYKQSQFQDIEIQEDQDKVCYCKQCVPSKKATLRNKLQDKTKQKLDNYNYVEDKNADEIIQQDQITNQFTNVQIQCTNQQRELKQEVIDEKADLKQSQDCDKAIRFNCPLCPQKSYSSQPYLKRHFTQYHKEEMNYYEEYVKIKN